MQTYTIGQNVYSRHDGSCLFFTSETPEPVKRALASLRGTDTRVRLFYGNRETGKTWQEENDVTGRVSASMGPCRVPLIIHNASSMGGGAIMADCILGILAKGGRWIYKAPNFDNGQWTCSPIDDSPGYVAAVYQNGALYARYKTLAGAERLRAFMAGERLAK